MLEWICCGDDSSVRADCQWSNKDYLKNNNTTELPQVVITRGKNKGKLQDCPNKGKLPAGILELRFIADPNHKQKQFTADLIALDTLSVKVKQMMTKMDTTRLGKNFGYMARSLPHLPKDQYCRSAKAVLDYDKHDICGSWCPRKNTSLQQQQAKQK